MDQQMISFDQSGYPRLKLIRRRREQSEEGKKLLQEVLRKARLRDLPPLPDINLHRSGSCRRSPALALARAKLTCYIADKSRKPRPRPQEYSTRLLHRPAELVLPPPMQSSWEQEILQLVPPRLAKKYAAKVDSLLQQVRADYEATLHDFGVRMMQLASGKVQLAVFPAAQRPWGRGRTDRYNVYLRHRSYFKKRLFLTHPILRVILDKSYLLIPQQLNDYRQYRDLGLVDLLKLRNAISADLKKSEALITNHWYPKICKMLPSKKGLSSVPSQLWVSFLNCASHVMASMITAAMTRTIGKVLEVMSDHHTVPLLKIDLLLEDTGIELFPSKSEIYQCFHNVLNTIAGLAQNLPALETWVSVVSDKALLKVELCPHYLEKAHRALDASLDLLFQPVFDYVASLNKKFSPLFDESQAQVMKEFFNSEPSFDKCCEKVKYFKKYLTMISCLVTNEYFFVGRICQNDVIRNLKELGNSYIADILNYLVRKHRKENDRICEVFVEVTRRAEQVPRSTEELMATGEYMEHASTTLLDELAEAIDGQLRASAALFDFTVLSARHVDQNTRVVRWLRDIRPVFRDSASHFEEYKREFESKLAEKTEQLNKQLDDLGPRLVVLDRMDEADNVAEYVQHVMKLLRKMGRFDEQVAWINKEEALFKFPLSTYPELDELKNIIFPFSRLIFQIHRWRRLYRVWMDGAFDKLSAKEIEEKVDGFYREISKMQKTYRTKIRAQMVENNPRRFKGNLDDADYDNLPAPIKLATKALQHIREFRQHLRFISILCNPALTQRHWNEMSQLVGFDLTPDAGTTLRKMIEKNLEHILEQFDVISISADKEKHLQENLSKMFTEWDDVKFTTGTYRETSIPILTDLDGVQAVLDNHLIKTLTMRGSAFVKPFEAEIKEWYEKLVSISETIEEWAKVQAQWLYLLPVFSSEDIVAQMPSEATLFQEVDGAYRKIVHSVHKEPRVLLTAAAEGILQLLEECMRKLETINDGVDTYLENKRLFFPRFFFLSNDELLEILSETKDPLRVQPHLKKCFEGISKLGFDDQLDIYSMFSSEGEEVTLVSNISTAEARGSVEKWLVQVEELMRSTLRREMERGSVDYRSTPRVQWTMRWPGQVVLCVSMMYWTADVHGILSGQEAVTRLGSYHSQLEHQLSETVALTRGHLSAQARITLGALVVLNVHAKDIVQELHGEGVSTAADFKWLAQLRYYWEDGVTARIINATVPYFYEYLGSSPRLVVTPLTDRCYRTLVTAYHLRLSGAPEGPAGTGKTETTKDLAKAVAVQCVVFNCSDGLDCKAMGKFFKGLASSGAWSCFDELNRMDVEVLSVVAQQILCVTRAVRAGAKTLVFEGTELALNPACYVCVTTNPGYAGRSELPDNLKVLFRPVAMMVPDFAMICDISLYSYGFVDARNLSVKIVSTYRLCSEQLSSQSHYDYGMRAVKTVLAAAGNMRLKFPDEKEDILLLRSIVDVNLPKFLSRDVPLFEGIISDLFPGTKLPTVAHDTFLDILLKTCEKLNIQPTEAFKVKVIQMYEMMFIRHSIMLVGLPFAGKSTAFKVLAATLTEMHENGHNEEPVEYEVINPKSVTMAQLYGQFDPVSHKWTDGVVVSAFRRFAGATDGGRKWAVFDGPVDAVWVENMNTVLDDNRKLCLNSGEIIALTPAMSVVFEVMDLLQASPATVSRCGMIHFEPELLGWKPFVTSWVSQLDPSWLDECQGLFEDLFDWLVPPSLEFIRKQCHQLVSAGSANLVRSTMLMVDMLLKGAAEENGAGSKHLRSWVQAAFMFAGVWGLGGTLDADSRQAFDEFYRDIWKGNIPDCPVPESLDKVDVPLPSEGLIHDYFYIFKQKGIWKYWPEVLKSTDIKETANIQETIIPTIDTLKYHYLMDLHLKHRHPMLLAGDTGTGKSFCVRNKMMRGMSLRAYLPAFATLTVRTTASQLQELILSKLHKHKKGTYGPANNLKCVMFLDDLNMPAKEAYGAQPPLELLRQLLDYGHWYDLKDMSKILLFDVMFVAAMGLSGGSRQEICKRFLSRFNVYSITPFSDESMSRIFTNLLLIALKRNGFATDVMPSIISIVQATLEFYHSVVENLRPTPAKSHYFFNLRDFGRVVQGCSLVKKDSVDNKKVFIKLWIHEVLRVFYDRLIDNADRVWLYGQLETCVQEHFKESFDTSLDSLPQVNGKISEESLQSLFFGTYMDVEAFDEEKKYEEVLDIEEFHIFVSEALDKYNAASTIKMDIVLFRYALEHLSRICRILAMPCGSGLLVGVGGSGRQSLTRLATAITGFRFFQPDISRTYGANDWRDDLKKVLKQSGGENRDTTFLLTENQLREELFLQDVDSLLNTGEVPNLFSIDEQQQIFDMVRLAAQGGNRNLDISALEVYTFFVNRCREKLHIILCLSPIGASFRQRLRLYPSLVNCCTIDWYQVWPEDALERVAQKYIHDVDVPEDVKKLAITACKYFHVTSRELSDKFYSATGRRTYVTSAAYLEMVRSYSRIMRLKQEEISQAEQRYAGGLERLLFAEKQVTEMQKRLSDMKPELESQARRTTEMMVNIERETANVQRASAVVREEEKRAKVEADAADVLQKDCEAELAAAVPILQDAISALNTLTPADITLVKSMKSPPEAVKMVMAAVCVLKDIKSDRITDPATGRKVLDYWGPSKRVLGDMGFLQSLKDYAKDEIPPVIMNRIRTEYLPNKLFRPEIVAKASSAAEGLCKWVIAMDKYDKAAKDVAPKREKLVLAEEKHRATMELLGEKKAELARLETDLEGLQAELGRAVATKRSLEEDMELCRKQLTVAEKLIGGLGGEKLRWSATATLLQKNFDSLAGDVLISCGIISYLAPFSAAFRNECVEDWQKYVVSLRIPSSDRFSFAGVLGSEIKIQSWNIFGLPRDDFSTDNAIIVDLSHRWSLMLDPQGQANKWIRSMEEQRNLAVVKFSDADYMQVIEKALEAGQPVLMENVGEELETALDPLLAKQIFQQGSKFYINLGDSIRDYDPRFRLYMTSKLRNPHLLPEVFNRVTVVDFSLTTAGLEDQLLGIVVAKERPNLEEMRRDMVVQSAADENTLKEVEDNILGTLATAETNILEDEHAIEVLDYSKVLSEDIQRRQDAARKTKEHIEAFRQRYRLLARHSSVLFYCITDLPNVNPMYQYSLPWFINLYVTSIETSKKSKFLQKRLEYLNETFTLNLYSNVCRSLFEKDKLMFSFILCSNIEMHEGRVAREEFDFFLTGGAAVDNSRPNPDPSWLSDKTWNDVCHVTDLPAFSEFASSLEQRQLEWKVWCDLLEPQEASLPAPWQEQLSSFQRLLLVCTLRPDKLIMSVRKYVEENMGVSFITPPPFNIQQSYQDSNCLSPLIFMLSPGSDPMSALTSFAERMGVVGKFQSVSLGQRQGPVARAVMAEARQSSGWVCLQNCHLAESWMPELEQLWDAQNHGNTSPLYRLWLTSYPSDKFPVSLLQNGVKMTNEPPTGLKQKLLRLYQSEPIKDPEFYKSCPGKDSTFVRLLYGICFFHSVIQERRKFGPIGWNIPYEFNESDLHISIKQLQMFVNEFTEVPYEAIAYTIGECNYGGRVTDDWDRRTITTILSNFVSPDVVNDPSYLFSQLGSMYGLPRRTEYQIYIKHIEALPTMTSPEIFGLHINAGIIRDLSDAKSLLSAVLLVNNGRISEAKDYLQSEKLLAEITCDILDKLPGNFDVEEANKRYPTLYSESMNTVLVQEMDRFNRLLSTIRTSLETLKRAIAGLVVMTPDLEAMTTALLINRVPEAWQHVSYPSLKPLASYVQDFLQRLKFLQKWYDEGKPATFWLSGFFSAQAFLTGAMQNYARKYETAIDLLTYDYDVLSEDDEARAPDDGVLVHGLFLDGARWDRSTKQLAEQRPKVLVDGMPLVWFKPCRRAALRRSARYACPLYRTSERKGVLSTTGHSTNHVLPVLLGTDLPASHWVQRGVALLCQLDD